MTQQDRDDIEAMPMTPANVPDNPAAAETLTTPLDPARRSGSSVCSRNGGAE